MTFVITMQCLNIIVFFTIMMAMPWQGFVIWFFGGFFILFAQIPAFLILLSVQLKDLKSLKDNKSPIHWNAQSTPIITFAVCMLISYVAGVFHLDDPFFHDDFNIEVTLNSDTSCVVKFEGTKTSESMTYQYEWDHNQLIYCSSLSSASSVLIDFNLPSGQLIKPGTYPLTSETNSIDSPLQVGGLFSDNALGFKFSPAIVGLVDWKFISGTLSIISVSTAKDAVTPLNKKTQIIIGTVRAKGKRIHRGA